MPVFCARWPDGTFSIVDAKNRKDALIQLDEFGDEPAELWRMKSCLLDFDLTDTGTFWLNQIGEETANEVMERGYPVLNRTLEADTFAARALIESAPASQQYDGPAAEILRNAVESERKRLQDFRATPATTERGKDLQRQLGGSGAYVDAIVKQAASEILREHQPNKKPN